MEDSLQQVRVSGFEEAPSQTEVRILIADDVQENLELLNDVLAENGYECVMVSNGVEAIDRLKMESIQLIVADAMMPKMDGLQLCREVKANPATSHIPFVIYTANYVDGEDEELAKSVGVDKYVVKYAGLGALVDTVNELCRVRYGYDAQNVQQARKQIDDAVFLEKHHAILVRKLEAKMAELEIYAESLARKNRELQASESRYRSLFEQSSIAICILDRVSGRILDINRQGLALLEYTSEEVHALTEFPFAGREVLQGVAFSPLHITSGEAVIKTRTGKLVEVDVSSVTFDERSDGRIMLFVRDVSEEKRTREQLIQAEKMMLMGCLAAGIAHDIRNPLAAVSINIQYLMQKLGEPEHEALESCLEGTRHIEQIIENILTLARVSPPTLQAQDINTIVSRALWFIKFPVQKKRLRTEISYSDMLPRVMVEEKHILQVMLNLLQNAIEASPEDAVIRVYTGMHKDLTLGERVMVSFEDSGPGISPEQRDNLFKPFRTTKPGGTGLGLAISHHIMERHGGEIQIGSVKGRGAIVQLLFPIHSPH